MGDKTWKYTINNYTQDDIDWVIKLDCTRHRCAMEVGEQGTPHLQGMITFRRTYRLAALKKLHDKAHWEVAICKDYNYECKVGNKMVVDVDNRKQGKRTDLDEVATMITEKKSTKEIALAHPTVYIKCFKGIEALQRVMWETERNWEMKVHIRWGEPGVGKTKFIFDNHKSEDIYVKPKNKWWDKYKGQEVVLIDDFDPDHTHDFTFDYYLTLFDRYKMSVEFKGGSCEFCSKIIYITSNFNPKTWFIGRKNRDAFFRRVVTVTEVTGR